MRGWGGLSRFSVENFCLTVLKIFAGQHFRVSQISGIEKFYAQGGYVTNFCKNFFESQYRIISLKYLSVLCYRKNVIAKKFMDKSQGEVSRFIFASIGLTVAKHDIGESFKLSLPLCIEKILLRWGAGGVSRFSVENFLSHSAEKLRRAIL